MMVKNPALSAFVAGFDAEFVFGQVRIRRVERGFELRHVADIDCDPAKLRLLGENEIRPLAQFTERGAYRPLKSAPNLKRGWRAVPRDEGALGAALDRIYPGAVADWFAAQAAQPPVTSYREYTGRQTGMYRITTFLNDATVGAVIRACCHKDFCLKRRLWTVEGLAANPVEVKSAIPCLEPCAILLEFARKIVRVEQEENTKRPLSAAEIAQRRAEAEAVLKNPDAASAIEESDFDAPNNPRRLRFILEKHPAPGTPPVG